MYHNRCIWCHSPLIEPLTIDTMFSKIPCLCTECKSNLMIKASCPRCDACGKKLAQDETICQDCVWIKQNFGFTNSVDFICDYHEDIKHFLHQYKTSGDIVLAQAIAEMIYTTYKSRYFRQFDLIIPMPISHERLCIRGFNHITEIFSHMNLSYHDILETEYREKQMHLNKRERIKQDNPFQLKQSINKNARILLVDDIYTTGLTMSHARSVLLSNKHCEIKMLAFARA
ncbi:ComF family protein [Macrococcoides caseolyticum]|uniref:ComF family protein n=1 Tax=Macrococcoides caseolyticum TaxID=69966 RepID=UPI001F16E179|nr:phosphoribosyltransferase family protein [Macrococcus caseolyticus]MCE4955849.1 ComF family protein [Macrococcus caseolyticus]